MGGKKKYIEMIGSFTEPFNSRRLWDTANVIPCLTWYWHDITQLLPHVNVSPSLQHTHISMSHSNYTWSSN